MRYVACIVKNWFDEGQFTRKDGWTNNETTWFTKWKPGPISWNSKRVLVDVTSQLRVEVLRSVKSSCGGSEITYSLWYYSIIRRIVVNIHASTIQAIYPSRTSRILLLEPQTFEPPELLCLVAQTQRSLLQSRAVQGGIFLRWCREKLLKGWNDRNIAYLGYKSPMKHRIWQNLFSFWVWGVPDEHLKQIFTVRIYQTSNLQIFVIYATMGNLPRRKRVPPCSGESFRGYP